MALGAAARPAKEYSLVQLHCGGAAISVHELSLPYRAG